MLQGTTAMARVGDEPLAMGAVIGVAGMLAAFLGLGAVIVTSVGIIAVASRRMR